MNDQRQLDLAWAAGFLDGEGCFTLLRRKGAQFHAVTAEIHVGAVQVKREPLDFLVELLGGRVTRLGTTKGGNEIWQWRITNAPDMRRVLPLLLPYFRQKKREAEICLAFAGTVRYRGRRPAGDYYSDDEIALRITLLSEMDDIRGRTAAGEVVSG